MGSFSLFPRLSKVSIKPGQAQVAFSNKPVDEETPKEAALRPFYLNRESRSETTWFDTLLEFADSHPHLTNTADLSSAFSENLGSGTETEPPF
jgi:hypothetical protein